MKLIIQIPCFNEAESLPITLASLPICIAGIDKVEWLVIDDGSTDKTSDIARSCGVHHILALSQNCGLAAAFKAGLEESLRLGADIIVNTDADNQYDSSYISSLIKPILNKKADIVIGVRPISKIDHFSKSKKILQSFGSYIVRKISKTNINDAPSGFRALSREAALRINIYNSFTYTLEMIIQAGQKGISITSVPICVNKELRPSRLFKSNFSYIRKSFVTIVRIFIVYKPFRFFMSIGVGFFSIGLALGIRYLFFMYQGQSQGHIQSLILASIMIGIGFQTIIVAFIADLLSVNRTLLEDIQYRARKRELE